MNSLDTCRFCDIVLGKYHYSEIDEPFASNDGFVAVASIGALVEGWSLIIPKAHQFSMRNIYGTVAFAEFARLVLPSLVRQYGPLIAFEHGANKADSITACGTEHAHLHLVPLGESLLPELQVSGLQWIRCLASEITSKSGKSEYLFYSELDANDDWQDPVGCLHVLEHPISQFFRRLIAGRQGKAKFFDYKRFPHLDTARQTRMVLVGAAT